MKNFNFEVKNVVIWATLLIISLTTIISLLFVKQISVQFFLGMICTEIVLSFFIFFNLFLKERRNLKKFINFFKKLNIDVFCKKVSVFGLDYYKAEMSESIYFSDNDEICGFSQVRDIELSVSKKGAWISFFKKISNKKMKFIMKNEIYHVPVWK